MTDHEKKPTVLLHLEEEDGLVNGILDACNSLGWRVINLYNTSDYIPKGVAPLGAVIGENLRCEALPRLLQLNLPIVSITADPFSIEHNLPMVLPDAHASGSLAADMFAERGFKDIGFIDYVNSPPIGRRLLAGIRAGVEADGRRFHHLSLGDAPMIDYATKYRQDTGVISNWLKQLPLPVGILACNHRMGARIICACEEAGLSVPDQVAVLTRGNSSSDCETAAIPLSAIDENRERQGRLAVQLLSQLSSGEPPPDGPTYVAPQGIVERRSTDAFAASDPRLTAAIRFIWSHMDCQITTDDVAAELNVSRSTVERVFKKCLGRGVNTELRRKRLECIKDLVANTDLTAAQIADSVGYADKSSFHREFKKAFGMTPGTYRKASGMTKPNEESQKEPCSGG